MFFNTQSQVPNDYTNSIMNEEVESLKKVKTVDFVADYGAVPDGETDNFNALYQFFQDARKEPLTLLIPKGEYYIYGDEDGRFIGDKHTSGLKGMKIIGEGIDKTNFIVKANVSELDKDRSDNPLYNYWQYDQAGNYFMTLKMDSDNKGVEISGFTVDGSLNPQDQFDQMESWLDSYYAPWLRGINITGADNIVVHDLKFQHMFGANPLTFNDYDQIDVFDVVIDDVGGTDNNYDGFGDALFFGYHEGDAVINVNNVHAFGKVSESDPSSISRCGIVVENLALQMTQNPDMAKFVDKNTTVNITNSTFHNYETYIHVESMAGDVYLNHDNNNVIASNYFIGSFSDGTIYDRTNRLYMEMLPYKRNNNAFGIYVSEWGKGKTRPELDLAMYNSHIKYITIDGWEPLRYAINYATYLTADFYNSTFEDIPNRLVANAGASFYDSQINLAKFNENTTLEELWGYIDYPDQTDVRVEFYGKTRVNRYPLFIQAEPIETPKWLTPQGEIEPRY